MSNVVVALAYTRDDICDLVSNYTQRTLEPKRFYEWLWACLIPQPKNFYVLRDVKKFLFVGFYLNVDRNFANARAELLADITAHPKNYEDSIYVEEFINCTAIAQLSRRRLNRRGTSRSGRCQRQPKARQIEAVILSSSD